jgi:NAD(P)H-flavin reductase
MNSTILATVESLEYLDIQTLSVTLKKPLNYNFQAGQYTHWTIPHINVDSRGPSREFSFASAPEEPFIKFLTRLPQPCSTYKQAMVNLKSGAPTYLSPPLGRFLLPDEISKPSIWFAGGVGIAPFRSFAKHLSLSNLPNNMIHLFFSNPNPAFPYLSDLSNISSTLSITRQIPENWPGSTGHFTSELLLNRVSDYKIANYYVCGHNQMALSILRLLTQDLKISRSQINLDLFTGY